ncbi:hypothetical protein CLF_109687 [Clonorchis sinensis]|uniref:Uncharacterized protein n=1 Tax=Clonorchis sinensis TaxID=79923 RepID=H2KUN8_CLOSI|nr:hypothetical protein CLF_109687 [Clonorchis sinensis]
MSGVAKQLTIEREALRVEVSSVSCSDIEDTITVSFAIQSLLDGYVMDVDCANTIGSLQITKAAIPNDLLLSKWTHLVDVQPARILGNDLCILIETNIPEAHWVIEQRLGCPKHSKTHLAALRWATFGPSPPAGTTDVYHLKVHPSGASFFSLCATLALRRFADDNRNVSEERTVSAVKEMLHADDCIASVKSVDIVKKPLFELGSMLSLGGSRLHKWIGNSPEVLNIIPISERASELVDLNTADSSLQKTLGLLWSIKSECFRYKADLPEHSATKCDILSCIASLHDPLRLVAPLLLQHKRLLRLREKKCGWDDRIDTVKEDLWNCRLCGIQRVGALEILRFIVPVEFNVRHTELHVFSDAKKSTADKHAGPHKTLLTPNLPRILPELKTVLDEHACLVEQLVHIAVTTISGKSITKNLPPGEEALSVDDKTVQFFLGESSDDLAVLAPETSESSVIMGIPKFVSMEMLLSKFPRGCQVATYNLLDKGHRNQYFNASFLGFSSKSNSAISYTVLHNENNGNEPECDQVP